MTRYLFIALAIICITACTKDFIVKNIKNASISIIAPADNFTTPDNSVTFWWDELDGAEKYNLQIVKPNFSAIQSLVLDTTVTSNKFIQVLSPGTYQWRVKGINAGGSTVYTVRTLVIDTTSNLTSILIAPISPVNGYLTASSSFSFSWNAVDAADKYEIRIETAGGNLIKDDFTTNTYYQYTLTPATGTVNAYIWKVKALNDFSVSQYNTPYTFTIDLAPPSQVSYQVKPLTNTTAKNTDTLKWARPSSDTWSDSLLISTDAAFSNVTRYKVYGLYKPISQLGLSNNFIQYWWKLRSVDSVGNASSYSSAFTFTLIP